jgi:PIN domain nuclease of toxin-antitoxin system
MSNYVLDASALLALLNNETGADRVQAVLEDDTPCFMSAVNWSEVVRKLLGKGLAVQPVADSLLALGLEFKPLNYGLAISTAQIPAPALSLGDRACLALAQTLGATALTADLIWETFSLGVTVELIR